MSKYFMQKLQMIYSTSNTYIIFAYVENKVVALQLQIIFLNNDEKLEF